MQLLTQLVLYLPLDAERDRQDTKFLEDAKVKINLGDERAEVDCLSQPANMGNREQVGLLTKPATFSCAFACFHHNHHSR